MTCRGSDRLELASTDPRVQPRIQLNFATDRDDLRRLAEGVSLAWRIATSQRSPATPTASPCCRRKR